MALVADSAPPPAVTANATVEPETALPAASFTATTSGIGSDVPYAAFWLLPETSATLAAAPAAAVAVKVTGEPVRPETDAVTVLVPATVPSLSTVCARPAASLAALNGVTEPPPAVTVKATVVPETALLFASVTA